MLNIPLTILIALSHLQGYNNAKKARKKADDLKPDVILVSPLERTLQTCNFLFGDREIPVFVEPILI
jgi:broad specificity phosphatase PhoE